MAVLTEGKNVGDWLKWEQENLYSRESITVLAGSGAERALTSGMVLAKRNTGAGTAAAVAGNTGNGTFGTVTVAGAKVGVYRATCIAAATNAGKFLVTDPDGIVVGVATVASVFTGGGLSFTIADGATDFAVGDSFTITVADGFKWVQLDDTASNGDQIPAGLLLLDVTAPDGTDAKGVAIVRDAIVSKTQITWPSGADATEKAAFILQLKALGILVREGA
jgi:hypothetical protein